MQGVRNSGQTNLGLTYNLIDYIPEDDFARTIRTHVDALDLSAFNKKYSHTGRASYPMKDMLCIILLGIFELDFTYRNLEKCCKYDIRYMWLLDCKTPDHSTIHRFHQRFMEMEDEFMKAQIKLLVEIGAIDLTNVSVDGTKIMSVTRKYSNAYLGTTGFHEKNMEDAIYKALLSLSDGSITDTGDDSNNHKIDNSPEDNVGSNTDESGSTTSDNVTTIEIP